MRRVPVLIAGAGAVGMALALVLARLGVHASAAHTQVRMSIAQAYAEAGDSLDSPTAARRRTAVAARIAALGNAENESLGIELGYAYPRSPIVYRESDTEVCDDPLRYVPTTAPGARLPSVLLADGTA